MKTVWYGTEGAYQLSLETEYDRECNVTVLATLASWGEPIRNATVRLVWDVPGLNLNVDSLTTDANGKATTTRNVEGLTGRMSVRAISTAEDGRRDEEQESLFPGHQCKPKAPALDKVIVFTGWQSYTERDWTVTITAYDQDASTAQARVQSIHEFVARGKGSGPGFEMKCNDEMDNLIAYISEDGDVENHHDLVNAIYVGCEGRDGQHYEVRVLGTDEIGIYTSGDD